MAQGKILKLLDLPCPSGGSLVHKYPGFPCTALAYPPASASSPCCATCPPAVKICQGRGIQEHFAQVLHLLFLYLKDNLIICYPSTSSFFLPKSSPINQWSPVSSPHREQGRLIDVASYPCPPKSQQHSDVEYSLPSLFARRGLLLRRHTPVVLLRIVLVRLLPSFAATHQWSRYLLLHGPWSEYP